VSKPELVNIIGEMAGVLPWHSKKEGNGESKSSFHAKSEALL
jgi:hypothetical protein